MLTSACSNLATGTTRTIHIQFQGLFRFCLQSCPPNSDNRKNSSARLTTWVWVSILGVMRTSPQVGSWSYIHMTPSQVADAHLSRYRWLSFLVISVSHLILHWVNILFPLAFPKSKTIVESIFQLECYDWLNHGERKVIGDLLGVTSIFQFVILEDSSQIDFLKDYPLFSYPQLL